MPVDKLPHAGITPARGRNLIINGNFDVWQRGTSNSAAAGSARYLADRWFTNSTGSTIATSQQAFGIQTAVPNNPRYFIRNVVVSSAGASNYAAMYYSVEDVTVTGGTTVTYSFWAKADASKNMTVEFIQSFGSGGGADVTSIGTTTINLTTTWQRFTVTVAIPAIVAAVSSSVETSYLRIAHWMDAGSNFNARTGSLGQQSGTFDFAQAQLEVGSTASDFEMLPQGEIWRGCQRYYNKMGGTAGALRVSAYSSGADTVYSPVYFPVKTRIIPTVTRVGTWTLTNVTGQPTVSGITDQSCVLQATMTGAGVAGFYCADSTTYITVDAEF